ncbi:MAG: Mur ligase domain-containing protein, partial [Deltaproteobacteria bacterium]|nr:Mur ligase domain-containing protein [Deltaproteobacteria bacterium]
MEIRKIVGETLKDIEGIAYHSRQVGKNFLFTAIRGMEADGHCFIDDAIERGAEAILLEEGSGLGGRTAIFVPNSRQALARVASNFYGDPSNRMSLVGITGTNGKTTTTFLLESILKK